jgi:hypothetical protein
VTGSTLNVRVAFVSLNEGPDWTTKNPSQAFGSRFMGSFRQREQTTEIRSKSDQLSSILINVVKLTRGLLEHHLTGRRAGHPSGTATAKTHFAGVLQTLGSPSSAGRTARRPCTGT